MLPVVLHSLTDAVERMIGWQTADFAKNALGPNFEAELREHADDRDDEATKVKCRAG